MSIRGYVVDDEPGAIALLKDYIEQTPGLELVGSSLSPVEAIDALTGEQAADITYMDVDMRKI